MTNFASVEWSHQRAAELTPLLALSAEEIRKLAKLISHLAALKRENIVPTEAQLAVLLQNLHTKHLNTIESVKGGLMVEFCGDGFVFERFLLKEDGQIPNHKYLSQKEQL